MLNSWQINLDYNGNIIECVKDFEGGRVYVRSSAIVTRTGGEYNKKIKTYKISKYNNLAEKFAKSLTSDDEELKKVLTFVRKFVILVL